MKVSQHAIKRINERSIDPKEIVDVIKNGIKMVNKHDNTKWTFKHKTMDIYAVCTGDMGTLVTVFYGKSITGYKG